MITAEDIKLGYYTLTINRIPEMGCSNKSLIPAYFIGIWLVSQVDSLNKINSGNWELIIGFLFKFNCDM